jgi:hypothetical protein
VPHKNWLPNYSRVVHFFNVSPGMSLQCSNAASISSRILLFHVLCLLTSATASASRQGILTDSIETHAIDLSDNATWLLHPMRRQFRAGHDQMKRGMFRVLGSSIAALSWYRKGCYDLLCLHGRQPYWVPSQCMRLCINRQRCSGSPHQWTRWHRCIRFSCAMGSMRYLPRQRPCSCRRVEESCGDCYSRHSHSTTLSFPSGAVAR